MAYSNTAAKVAVRKRVYPHNYCTHYKCLWLTRHADGRVTPCPKHANSVLALPPAVNPAHVHVTGSPFHVTGIDVPEPKE